MAIIPIKAIHIVAATAGISKVPLASQVKLREKVIYIITPLKLIISSKYRLKRIYSPIFPIIAKAPVTMKMAILSTSPNLNNIEVKKQITGER